MKELAKKEYKKGDYITPEQLEKELGYAPSGLQLLSVCKGLDDANNQMTIKCEGDGIRFLTDSEATNYNHNYFGRHLEGMFRRNKKMLSVDQSNLSEPERENHKRKINIQSVMLVGLKDSLRSLLPVKSYDSGIKKLF